MIEPKLLFIEIGLRAVSVLKLIFIKVVRLLESLNYLYNEIESKVWKYIYNELNYKKKYNKMLKNNTKSTTLT